MVQKRKSPIRHIVKKHKRRGKWIESFERGSGTQQRRIKKRAVGYTDSAEELSLVIRDLLKDYGELGKSPEYISTGECELFAGEVINRFPQAEYGTTDDYTDLSETAIIAGRRVAFPGHVWIRYRGKHYDAETPFGVDRWFDLPIFRRESELASWSPKEKAKIGWT